MSSTPTRLVGGRVASETLTGKRSPATRPLVRPLAHPRDQATSTRSREAAEMSQSITHMFGGVGDLRFDRKHRINIVIADT